MDTKKRICIIGLGVIGLPVAQHTAKYYPTVGYDISSQAIEKAKTHNIQATTQLPHADIYVVAVNTWFKNNQPDMTAVESCTQQIAKTNPQALVCYESTLFPGTARKLAEKYSLSNVAVCPHRLWPENTEKYGVAQPRVLGALNEESLKAAKEFYSTIQIPTSVATQLEVAELSKVVENSDRYVKIAFVEEVYDICAKLGLNFYEVREACNTKWNVELLEPRDGIGGTCLPKDVRYLEALADDGCILDGAIKADELYRKRKGSND